ncbi:redox-sensitive bicupin YhaK (pirin superfamily) [Arthrobacter silviterrae]|uniref:Pirin family protein n=1 Tax=Arthrobacter silviterrae TaxID=2026658 RepID=A0ABX0D9K5_9MICC|nr:pirin family protein [Arthrobacter silviterrae]MDQ0276095.1 redox-sensitive bicupin YhaK (pirin superfamily) [Arthrobacter silviterrae]NGN82560.1 pirin family protein [Arthrobacter silviterrae]
MSSLDSEPQELLCPSSPGAVEVLEPRMVPLGGPRAMTVRRTLPQRQRSLIGAWCFVDHYGPDDVSATGGMAVPPHPHTGLQTVSWLFTGEVEHTDSAGYHAMVRPGELNLMTAGRGISHSEYSTPGTTVLHGAQLWVALPEHARFMEPTFEHFRPVPVQLPGVTLSVFLGSLAGGTSPVVTHTPLLGAELRLDAGATVSLDVDPAFEHGFLVDSGTLSVDGNALAPGELGYTGPGRGSLTLVAGQAPVRLLLIGGTPLGESIVMWWNFVGRSHEEVVAFRAAWQAEIAAFGTTPDGMGGVPGGDRQFGLPANQVDPPLPAPGLPTVNLRPRSNPS